MITFSIGKKAKYKPWVNNSTLNLIRKKQAAAQDKDYIPTAENIDKFKKLKKESDLANFKAKQTYYHQRIEENITNPKKIWKIMSDVAPSSLKS